MKKIIVSLMAICMLVSLAACGKKTEPTKSNETTGVVTESPTVNESESTKPEESTTELATSMSTEKDTETTQKEDTKSAEATKPTDDTESVEEVTESAEPTNSDIEEVKLNSDDWTSLALVVENKALEFPYNYETFKELGYEFNLSDYGYDDGYIMNAGDSVYGTIKLENPALDKYKSASVTVGFKNFSDEAKDILDCSIWTLEIDNCYGNKLAENKLNFTLAKGITVGSTKDEIITAYGEPSDTYEAEAYTVLTYDHDYTEKMKLTVYNEFGLTAVELSKY